MLEAPSVVVITGVMAAGKSTVARALAQRLPYAAHVPGDQFRRMIVSGQANVAPPLSSAGTAQLRLRQRLAALVAREYAAVGITAVVQDLYLGDDLPHLLEMLGTRQAVYLVVLAPRPEVIAQRERDRAKAGYGHWSVSAFDAYLRESTPQLGLWLDTSDLTVAQTVERILADRATARASQ